MAPPAHTSTNPSQQRNASTAACRVCNSVGDGVIPSGYRSQRKKPQHLAQWLNRTSAHPRRSLADAAAARMSAPHATRPRRNHTWKP
eukprot:scaffold43821_cov56-Phaeocystis_antarctica.AAC.2